MENLVKIENEQIVTDSRQVAEHFEKEHKNILRSIKEILAAQNCAVKFYQEYSYLSERGKQYPAYLMNRDGFTLLAMGFTGKKALEWKLKYINAFNEMEAKLKQLAQPRDSYMIADPVERALKWAEEEKQRQNLLLTTKQQQQVISELKPKADYTDRILQSKSLVTITQIAKDYGMSGRAMNEQLHKLKVIYKLGSQWLLYSKYQAKGYTHSETVDIEHSDGRSDVVMNTKWTQKGRLFLYELLKANDVLPVIERENVA